MAEKDETPLALEQDLVEQETVGLIEIRMLDRIETIMNKAPTG
jgi:hypothetical protein